MQRRLGRSFSAVAVCSTLAAILAACGQSVTVVDGATAGPAGLPSAGSSPTYPGDGGCPERERTVPDDAGTAAAGDLDDDGQDDEIWLDGSTLGVRTASGAVFATDYEPGDEPATALGTVLGDGTAIVLLDTGPQAALYAVIDCEIVVTQNKYGKQYTFDLGINGYGTGVGCPEGDKGLFLAGYKTQASSQSGYGGIVRTRIDLTDDGAQAANGVEADLGEHAQSSASWTIATGVSCGDAEKATAT